MRTTLTHDGPPSKAKREWIKRFLDRLPQSIDEAVNLQELQVSVTSPIAETFRQRISRKSVEAKGIDLKTSDASSV